MLLYGYQLKGGNKMNTNTKATDKYKKDNYDTITFPMLKGCRDVIKDHIKDTGESYQSFLRRCVINQINRDRQESIAEFNSNFPDNPITVNSDPNVFYLEENVKKQTVKPFREWLLDSDVPENAVDSFFYWLSIGRLD